jgi:hypothetical protein
MPGDDETQPEGNGQDQQTGETADQQTLGINNVVYRQQSAGGIYIYRSEKYIVPQSSPKMISPTVRKCLLIFAYSYISAAVVYNIGSIFPFQLKFMFPYHLKFLLSLSSFFFHNFIFLFPFHSFPHRKSNSLPPRRRWCILLYIILSHSRARSQKIARKKAKAPSATEKSAN